MSASNGTSLNPGHILDDPANFLHSIDVDHDRAMFLKTDPQMLRDSSFIDGRTPIGHGPPQPVALHDIFDVSDPAPTQNRFIFSVAFCGSTLLSRLLDVPGRSLVLKEPLCLADLATWKIERLRAGQSIDALKSPLKLATAALRRRFTPSEKVTVKPGSWSNVLIDDIVENTADVRPIFMTISRLRFLLAVFRGGAERMHHSAKIAWHLAPDADNGEHLLREAVAAGADPLRKAANLTLLARFLQVGAFQRAARSGGWYDKHVIDLDDLVASPLDATTKAADALGLDMNSIDLENNVRSLSKRHAKETGRFYLAHRYDADDRALLIEHRQVFDDALAWAERTLGPQLSVTA